MGEHPTGSPGHSQQQGQRDGNGAEVGCRLQASKYMLGRSLYAYIW